MVTLSEVEAGQEQVLRNLVQFYAYDFAELAGWDVPASGRFPDDVADRCTPAGERHAFLINADGALAGFAIVDHRSRLTAEAGVHDMAEFFIVRRHRRHGVGAAAVAQLFTRFPGRWEVRQSERNVVATEFWRAAIARTVGEFGEVQWADATWRGPVQRFFVRSP